MTLSRLETSLETLLSRLIHMVSSSCPSGNGALIWAENGGPFLESPIELGQLTIRCCFYC